MRQIRFAQLFLLLCSCVTVQAQQPTVPSSGRKQPVGHIRVWHFATNLKAPVSVSLVGAGSPKPVILARALKLADIMNYRDVPIGQLKVSVRAGAGDYSVS